MKKVKLYADSEFFILTPDLILWQNSLKKLNFVFLKYIPRDYNGFYIIVGHSILSKKKSHLRPALNRIKILRIYFFNKKSQNTKPKSSKTTGYYILLESMSYQLSNEPIYGQLK